MDLEEYDLYYCFPADYDPSHEFQVGDLITLDPEHHNLNKIFEITGVSETIGYFLSTYEVVPHTYGWWDSRSFRLFAKSNETPKYRIGSLVESVKREENKMKDADDEFQVGDLITLDPAHHNPNKIFEIIHAQRITHGVGSPYCYKIKSYEKEDRYSWWSKGERLTLFAKNDSRPLYRIGELVTKDGSAVGTIDRIIFLSDLKMVGPTTFLPGWMYRIKHSGNDTEFAAEDQITPSKERPKSNQESAVEEIQQAPIEPKREKQLQVCSFTFELPNGEILKSPTPGPGWSPDHAQTILMSFIIHPRWLGSHIIAATPWTIEIGSVGLSNIALNISPNQGNAVDPILDIIHSWFSDMGPLLVDEKAKVVDATLWERQEQEEKESVCYGSPTLRDFLW